MAYRRNDENGRVVGFRDGQPVYKKSSRDQGGKRSYRSGNTRPSGSEDSNKNTRSGQRDGSGRDDKPRRYYGERAGGRFEKKPERFGKKPDRFTKNAEPAEVPVQPAEEAELPNIIMGRNPVKEAIKSGRMA